MSKLTAEQQQNASILLATLQYQITYHTGQLVFDDRDPQKEFYLKAVEKTKADVSAARHDRVKKRLDQHLQMLRYHIDFNFNSFIKIETGYNIDIYEEFKTKVLPIIANGILTHQDFFYATMYLNIYSKDPLEEQRVAILAVMLKAYEAEHANDPDEEEVELLSGTVTFQMSDFGEPEIVCEQFTSEVMTKQAYEVYQSDQPKQIISYSPNGINQVKLESDEKGEFASTSVSISLANGSGTIYSVKGEKLPIKAYWKDNHTIMVETKKEYEHNTKVKQVSNYEQVYKIEYVEG